MNSICLRILHISHHIHKIININIIIVLKEYLKNSINIQNSKNLLIDYNLSIDIYFKKISIASAIMSIVE
jgi:hypothetical protein